MKIRFEPDKKFQGAKEAGLQVAYGATKRALPKWRWYGLLVLAASPLLYFVWHVFSQWFWVQAVVELEQQGWTEQLPLAGRIQVIAVKPGQQVAAGQLLLQLDSPQLTEQQRRLRLELDVLTRQRQAWQQHEYQRQNSAHERAPVVHPALRQQRHFAQQQVNFWQQRVQRMQWLHQRQAATSAELASARLQLEAALMNQANLVKEKEPEPSPIRANLEPIDLVLRQTQVQSELTDIEHQLAQLQITAAQAGLVTDVLVELGQNLAAGSELVRLDTLAEPELKAYLAPKDREFAVVGQQGQLQLPSGGSIRVEVSEPPRLSGLLPARLTPPLAERSPQLILRLRSLEPLPPELRVKGLAMPVVFDLSLQSRWGSWWANSITPALGDRPLTSSSLR